MTYQSYLEELREVIRRVHGVDSEHVRTVAVKETSQGKTVWDGLVEIFKLKGHPSAERAYAWACGTNDPKQPRRHVIVLDSHLKSAQDAVRAAIAQERKSPEPTEQETESRKAEEPKSEAKGQDRACGLQIGAIESDGSGRQS